jgi:two-component system chemotaxis response regulator CheY
MPDMHGFDVLRFVRAHDRFRGLPVVVLTTRGDDASRQIALQAGASAFLTKPFTPDVLLSMVRGLIGTPVAAPQDRR